MLGRRGGFARIDSVCSIISRRGSSWYDGCISCAFKGTFLYMSAFLLAFYIYSIASSGHGYPMLIACACVRKSPLHSYRYRYIRRYVYAYENICNACARTNDIPVYARYLVKL